MARPRKFDTEAAIDAAMNTFWTKGYTATSTDDLAESTGMLRGSLYNAFGGKRQLFELALRRYREQGAAGANAMADDQPPLERIRRLLRAGVDRTTADHRGCLAVNTVTELAGPEPELAHLARQAFIPLESALATAVEAGRVRGEIRADRTPQQLARQVMAAFHGLLLQAKAGFEPESLHATIDAVVDDLRA
ncbi:MULTISPECIES: TetR family transcriptional regulator [unclassified Kitasatospora]|uniref:TetR/AcrR family transcriptional regulator n=1 Tax=unclassified Kitasatospora TaxID=2633591 RepID=UPI0034095E47